MQINKNICLITFFVSIFSFFFLDKGIAYFFQYNSILTEKIFRFITIFGQSEIYLIPGLFLYFYYKKTNDYLKNIGITIFTTVAVSGILSIIFKVIFAKSRPSMLFEHNISTFSWFDIGYSVNSFPSGHATTSFSAFILLFLIFPRYKYIFILLAILISFSRVVLTSHYLSDVLVGSLLGGLTSYFIFNLFFVKQKIKISA